MSNQNCKIRIKFGNYEIEGDKEFMEKCIEKWEERLWPEKRRS